jgi:stage II sporulation protein D
MRRLRVLSIVLLLALVGACVNLEMPLPAPFSGPGSVKVRTAGRVRTVPLEEYVLGSALSEHTPLEADPATVARIFDVQSVLARTYAIGHLGRHRQEGFDLCDGTHCQLYQPGRIKTSRFADAARRAVDRTRGVVLTFARQPADALYHADCGGHTASADDVWGNRHVPYLSGSSDGVPAAEHRTWRFEAPEQQIRAALNADARSAVGRRLIAITVAARDGSGRAARLQVSGDRASLLRGEDLRAILNRAFGPRAIMSTRFELQRRGSMYHFSGTGFGHGVGLCQAGAAARAARGAALGDILSAYFPGVALTRLADAHARRAILPARAARALVQSP